MTLCIDSITTTIENFFHDRWWEKYSFQEEEQSKLIIGKKRFSEEILSVKTEIFDTLNKSVFLGEYIQSDAIFDKLESIKRMLTDIDIPLPPDLDVQSFLQQEVNIDFIEAVESALNLYSHDALKIKKQYSFDKKEYILSKAPFVKAFEENNRLGKSSFELLDFFDSNLQLASFDHSLSSNPGDFEILLELSDSNTLEKFGPNKFIKLYIDKCNFLKNKWITRKQHLNESTYYLSDNVEKKADASEFTNPLFSHWKDYILSHYELSRNWQAEIIETFDEIKHKPLNALPLLDLHRLIKYYKDVNKNIENLHEIVVELERRLQLAKNSPNTKYHFQTHALALSYALNNEFSLFLEDQCRTETEVDDFYKKILQFETSTGNYNYFPQFKYFGFLVKQLNKIYEDRIGALDFIEPAKQIIAKCKLVFDRYQHNAEWSDKHYNYVFQLPYEECLVKTQSNFLPEIFTASSFVLPLPKDKNKSEFDKDKQRLTFLMASVDVYTNLQADMKHLKKVTDDVDKMKQDIHSREIKSMEILGIFTAVVTFVLGSLPTFKFIHTATQAFLFMFALATSLGFFVFILFTVNRGKESMKKNSWLIIGCAAVVISVWVILIFFNKDPNIIQINRNEVEIEKNTTDTGMVNRMINAMDRPDTTKLHKLDTTHVRQ